MTSLFVVAFIVGFFVALYALREIIGVQYISNDQVGIVEKLWGGSIKGGRIIAINNEAGYQPEVLRGGLHFRYPRWKYLIHRVSLVQIPQGKIAYVYARDGEALTAGQMLGREVPCSNFQDARAFLLGPAGDSVKPSGQRGRQRAILREGVYAINIAMFIVVAQDRVYTLRSNRDEETTVTNWQRELQNIDGFSPVVIGNSHDSDDVGIVTVQDGPSLPQGEIIAPEIADHNNFQDPEAFLRNGGRRGRQMAVLTDGTYIINRWFATIERIPKVVIPIGSVGVVNIYFGSEGADTSGDGFRHGERVKKGQKGVWETPLGPGKYAFNQYAGVVTQVPTTNFVLHWITGKSESHKYDEGLGNCSLKPTEIYD